MAEETEALSRGPLPVVSAALVQLCDAEVAVLLVHTALHPPQCLTWSSRSTENTELNGVTLMEKCNSIPSYYIRKQRSGKRTVSLKQKLTLEAWSARTAEKHWSWCWVRIKGLWTKNDYGKKLQGVLETILDYLIILHRTRTLPLFLQQTSSVILFQDVITFCFLFTLQFHCQKSIQLFPLVCPIVLCSIILAGDSLFVNVPLFQVFSYQPFINSYFSSVFITS